MGQQKPGIPFRLESTLRVTILQPGQSARGGIRLFNDDTVAVTYIIKLVVGDNNEFEIHRETSRANAAITLSGPISMAPGVSLTCELSAAVSSTEPTVTIML